METPSAEVGHAASVPHKKVYTEEALALRRNWVAEATGANLEALTATQPPRANLFQGNIESHVGFVQIPIGVAGPLHIKGQHAEGIFYVPLATTEGALVASCTRGMRAVTESGGATVRVVSDQMMRAPMFTFESLTDALAFADWVKRREAALKSVAESQSRTAKLLSIHPVVLGDTVCLQLSFFTGDAYGANMVMKCSWAACNWIRLEFPRETGLQYLDWFVDSNLGAEKKVNAMTYTASLRGKRVVAETHLKREVMQRVLKVTPEDLFEALVAGVGPTWAAHMLGCNVNFANVVAALFTATGQDIATVPESSQGQINFRLTEEGLYFGVLLPNVVVATIGGGTGLPSQRACLEMLGSYGTGKAKRLAEIVAASAMCLDISTYSAIAMDHFVQAHERLGRNRPRTGTGPISLPPGFELP
jgi:NADP-dependent 3-hydroxy-3-methylglutaryl-CoA reductase